jgi:hypothetical protein
MSLATLGVSRPTAPDDLDRLGDEIAVLAAHLDAATARVLTLLREFDSERRRGARPARSLPDQPSAAGRRIAQGFWSTPPPPSGGWLGGGRWRPPPT